MSLYVYRQELLKVVFLEDKPRNPLLLTISISPSLPPKNVGQVPPIRVI